MNFIRIAFKHVSHRFRNYIIYFTSTIFSVVIFNLFCSIYYNPSFAQYRFGVGKITTLFRGTAIAVLLFSSIFVLYSSSCFLKSQKKEIAIYALLGMRRQQIATMMFLESFLVGMLAMVCGTLIGTLSAGRFTSLLMRFMAVGTEVIMTIAPQAILVTVIAFFVLFMVSGILAYRTIYRYKLITLLSAQKRHEGVPKYSVLGVIASLIVIVAGYLIAMRMDVNQGGFKLLIPALIVIMLMTLGTWLLFRNTVPMITYMCRRANAIF